MMQKKNLTVSESVNTPQQETSSIPNQVGLTENMGLPSPSDASMSVSAPSTSASLPPPRKVSQNILNNVVQSHLSKNKFPESTDTFFKALEKSGYSKDQVDRAKEYNKAFLLKKNADATEQVQLTDDGTVAPTQGELKKQSDKENFKDVNPVAGVLLKTGKYYSGYLDKQAQATEEGGKQMFRALGKVGEDASSDKPATQKLKDIGTDALNVIAGGVKTAFGVAGGVIPELAAFNNGVEGLHALPDNIKSELTPGIPEEIDPANPHKSQAEKFDKIIDFPFTAASQIASMMGRNPEEGSAELAVYDILNVLIPIGAHKAATGIPNKIADINSFREILEKAKEGTATPEEIRSVVDMSEGIKEVTIPEVEKALVKQKLDKYTEVPNEEIVKAQAEGETPGSIRAKANELPPENIQEKQQLETLADAMEIHEDAAKYPKEYIDAIIADETIPAEQKQVYIDQITNSAQMDAGINAVEQAKIDHVGDIEALSNPGSKEFYDKAMQALDDPGIVDRIKSSLDEAVKSGEITAEEAAENFDHFQKVVDIDKTIPEKIKDPEDRIEAGKLIEKKNNIKESVKGKDSVLAAKEIENSKYRIEKIDEQLNEIVNKAKEKQDGEKNVHAIWRNALKEMKDENLKKGIEKKGIDYLVNSESITENTARELVDGAIKVDKLKDVENAVVDASNKMDNTNRGVLSAVLGKHYFDLAEAATDPVVKEMYYDNFYKFTDKAADLATQGGQAGNAIGKIIKKMYINNPETVVAEVKNRMRKNNDRSIDQEKFNNTYESIKKILETEEGQKAVTEEISKRSESIFGKETQKKISDLFDKAKVDTKNKLFDASIGLPIELYNTAVEIMKQSALLGAKGARIIEEGIQYIREKHKEDWDDTAFRKEWDKNLRDFGVEFEKKRNVSEKEVKSILDVIEKKAERLKPEGKKKFLKDVISEVENEGGLDQQRFKDMYAEALGLDVMTPEMQGKIRDLLGKIKEAESAKKKMSDAYDDVIEDKNENTSKQLSEAKDEFRKLAREADKAQSELSSIMREKKDFADTMISSIQTNLLTPISLARNIVGVAPDVSLIRPMTNIARGALNTVRRSVEDLGWISERAKEEGKFSPLARTKGAWLAVPDAARNFYTAILTGEAPNRFGERSEFKKIEPKKAAKRIYDALKGDKKMSGQDWASSILEATSGVPGSIIGKLLVGPDSFVRTIAEQSKLYEEGASKGLKGEELEKFVKLPPDEALGEAKKYADEVTYQQDNKASKIISSLKSSLKTKPEDSKLMDFGKQTARILGTTLAPYVKTPTNVLVNSMKLLYPEISLGQGIKEMKAGNRVVAEEHFAKYVSGIAVRKVISDMAANGIITPATDYSDKKQKGLEESGGKVGGQLNYSRMMRYLTLQDEGEQPDDVWIDYKWLGPLGLVMGVQSSIAKEDQGDEQNMIEGYADNTAKRSLYALKYTSELPYIQSMGLFADALKDPENKTSSILVNTLSTVSSGVVPRTVTQISQASADDKKRVYDKDLGEYIKKKFKYDYFSGDDLPSKINIWGEKVANSPKDNNKYAWYTLNFYKDRNPDENSLSYKLQELMEKTGDKGVVPTPPSNTVSIGKNKVMLDDKEYEDFQTFVGKSRQELAKAYIDHGTYETDNDSERIDKLQKIYLEGFKQGKNMLVNSHNRLTEIENANSGTSSMTGEKRKRGSKRDRKRG